MSDPTKPVYQFEDFRLDVANKLLLRDGKRVRLKEHEFLLLRVLIENRNGIMSSTDLVASVWVNGEVGSVEVTVSNLRDKLGEDAGENKYIRTFKKKGYQFVAEVVEQYPDETPAATLLPQPPVQLEPVEPAAEEPAKVPAAGAEETEETPALVEKVEAGPTQPPPAPDDATEPAGLEAVETPGVQDAAPSESGERAEPDAESDAEPENKVVEEHPRPWELTFNQWVLGHGWKVGAALAAGVALSVTLSVLGLFWDDPSKFRREHFTDPVRLAKKLRPGNNEADRALYLENSSQYLQGKDRLTETENVFGKYGAAQTPDADELGEAMARDFNRLIKDPVLFKRVPSNPFPDEVRNLVATESSDAELARRNRLLLETAYPGEIKERHEWLKPVLCFIHGLVLACALLFNVRPRRARALRRAGPNEEKELMEDCGYASQDEREEWEEAKEQASDALQQYETCWKRLLIFWTLLYFVLALLAMPGAGPQSHAARQSDHVVGYVLTVLTTLLNNFSALALFFAYVVLNEITVIREQGRNVGDVPWGKGAGLVVLFTVAEGVLVWASDASMRGVVVQRCDWVSGIAGGLAMALFIGRLQSKLLGAPHWLLFFLYVYAAIQPLYAFIGQDYGWAVLLINAALALKCLLYLYVVWLFKSGRLLFYLVRVKRIYERVDAGWERFHRVFARAG